MKFLCIDCDHVMDFAERQLPGDGTMAAVFRCARCGHEVAMLTNPMETRLVSGLGVRVGGRTVPDQPMELLRSSMATGREGAFEDAGAEAAEDAGAEAAEDAGAEAAEDAGAEAAEEAEAEAAEDAEAEAEAAVESLYVPPRPGPVAWSPAARERLAVVPSFVRGMVKRIYTEWAWEQGIDEMTPETMDRARSELGMEGM